MAIDVERRDNLSSKFDPILEISGKMEVDSSGDSVKLKKKLDELLQEIIHAFIPDITNPHPIIFDLSKLEIMTPAGLGHLVKFYREARHFITMIKVVVDMKNHDKENSPSARIVALSFDEIFKLYTSLEEALRD